MNAQVLLCPKCRTPSPEAFFNTGSFDTCPSCRSPLQCHVFPAYYAAPRIGRPGEPLVDAGEASCFFHADKKAVIACESCGRFVCALCDLDFDGRHICPSCLKADRKKGTLGNLDHFRFSWSGLALLLTIAPLIAFYPMTVVTAPAAIVVAIIGLRKPPSMTGSRRWFTLTVAMLFAMAQIGAWIWFGREILKTFISGG